MTPTTPAHGRAHHTPGPGRCRRVAQNLAPAGPDHPWTGVRFTAAWGSREKLDPVRVVPDQVAEFSADTAISRAGVWRHPLRFVRLRLDVTADDVPPFGEGAAPAAG